MPLGARIHWERRELTKALVEDRADVLLQPSNVPMLGRTSLPTVQVLHNIAPLAEPRKHTRGRLLARLLVLQGLTKIALRRADGVIFLSEQGRDLAIASGFRGRGVVIRPGITDSSRRAPRRRTIVVVAHLFRYKRVEDAIRAFGITQLHDSGYGMVIYGLPFDVPYAREIHRLAARYPGVHVAGGHPPASTRSAVRTAAAVVQPSALENAPEIVFEAISEGTPIVASDIGAHREILASGLYPLGDVNALAEQLAEAVKGMQNELRIGLTSWSHVAKEITEFCARFSNQSNISCQAGASAVRHV